MNIQKVNSVSFGELYYQNTNKNYKVNTHQLNVWTIVNKELNPYTSNLVKNLEEKADVDVVLFFNTNGSSTLKLKDTFDKFADSACDDPDTIANIRSPKIQVNFTQEDQKYNNILIKKLKTFITSCNKYLETCGLEYNKVKSSTYEN